MHNLTSYSLGILGLLVAVISITVYLRGFASTDGLTRDVILLSARITKTSDVPMLINMFQSDYMRTVSRLQT